MSFVIGQSNYFSFSLVLRHSNEKQKVAPILPLLTLGTPFMFCFELIQSVSYISYDWSVLRS